MHGSDWLKNGWYFVNIQTYTVCVASIRPFFVFPFGIFPSSSAEQHKPKERKQKWEYGFTTESKQQGDITILYYIHFLFWAIHQAHSWIGFQLCECYVSWKSIFFMLLVYASRCLVWNILNDWEVERRFLWKIKENLR